ncbi:hypothetical protein TI39_contig491g00007 [Zymoseptoria brevis]|uniref:Uncharacterized protein n=1 Tax=Zymoseptoria brevis TaxID=1047168 RepID=A0A0F4GJ99_9PEZI|nr:hypothetical protein TI39_contig491g00007 [Zymoseptoria brevis]
MNATSSRFSVVGDSAQCITGQIAERYPYHGTPGHARHSHANQEASQGTTHLKLKKPIASVALDELKEHPCEEKYHSDDIKLNNNRALSCATNSAKNLRDRFSDKEDVYLLNLD